MPNLQGFLDGLASEARRTLATDEAAAFVDEAREHLEASIQARLELGMSPEDAEREAIGAFGTPERIRQEIERHEPRFDRGFSLAFLGTAAFVFWAFNASTTGLAWLGALTLYLALHGALVVTSLRVRRLQWEIFAAVLLPLWLGTATFRSMSQVTVFYPGDPGGTAMPRKEIAERTRWFDAESKRFVSGADRLLDAYARYVKGESDLGVHPGAILDVKGRLQLKPQPNRALGEAEWKASASLWMHAMPLTAQDHWQRARLTEAAAGRPWWTELPHQLGPALEQAQTLQTLGLYGAGHTILWAIGARARRRKARAKPPRPA